MSRTRRLVIGLAVAGLLLLVIVNVRSIETGQHTRIRETLSELRQMDAELNAAVIKLRHGLLHNYDTLVHTLNVLKQHARELGGHSAVLPARGADDIRQDLATLSQTLASKEEMIEEFKFSNSVLKNSFQYFPRTIDALVHNPQVPPALRQRLHFLLNGILLLPVEGTAERYEQVAELVNALRNEQLSEPLQTRLDHLIKHAQNILVHQGRIDSLTRAIVPADAPLLGQRLEQTYNKWHESQVRESNFQRFLLVLVAIILIYYAIYSFVQLRGNARELAESHRFLQTLTDALGEGVYTFDASGRCTFVNREAERMLGWKREDLIGREIPEFSRLCIPGRDASPGPGSSETVRSDSCMLTRKDGTVFTASLVTVPFIEHGTARGWVTTFQDVTEKRLAEQALKESEERFRTLSTLSSDWYWEQDENFRFTAMSGGIQSSTGADPREYIGKTRWEIPYVGMSDADWRQHKATLESHLPFRDLILQRLDGEGRIHYLTVNGQPVFDEQGNYKGYRGAGKDITEQQHAQEALRMANRNMEHLLKEQEKRAHHLATLSELSHVLQSCLSSEEAYSSIAKFCQRLFPQEAVALYVLAPSRNFLQSVAAWGNITRSESLFAPETCWALRRGQVHQMQNPHSDLVCTHISSSGATPQPYLCIPLIAQSETLGLVYLEFPGGTQEESTRITENKRQLAVTMAEQIALALANINLRDTLRQQSIRDSLTGLFNRRYLEESMQRELARAHRKGGMFAVVMFDVDHFKRFNDTFGHEAGDIVLRGLGRIIRAHVRESDIACRYGGEEFVILMPDASLDTAVERGEKLRQAAQELELLQDGQALGSISISLGVAVFPQHADSTDKLIQAADAALYRAKRAGRNRVEISG